MPILSVFVTLLKSRFFVIYYRRVTLADGRKSLPCAKGGGTAQAVTEGLSIPQSAALTAPFTQGGLSGSLWLQSAVDYGIIRRKRLPRLPRSLAMTP